MWSFIHKLGSPRWFYRITTPWLPWLELVTAGLLLTGAVWGLAFAPADFRQGNSYRIIFIHVPTAFVSLAGYYLMATAGAFSLVWKIKLADMALRAAAGIGAAMTFCALVTGSIWGKPTWGTWWVWDARITSLLVLLFLYLGGAPWSAAAGAWTAPAKPPSSSPPPCAWPPFSFLWASAAGVALIAFVGSAFINGGILEALGSQDDGRSFMQRFHRGGGHFFWRFVRLNAIAFSGVAIVIGIAAALRSKVMTPLSDSEWEPAGMFWGLVGLAATGLVALWLVLALDYARIRVARDGSRAMLPAYFGAMRFVARRAFATYGLASLTLGFLGALFAAYVAC